MTDTAETRAAGLARLLSAFLDRYVVPKHIETEEAEEAEMDALLRALLNRMPQVGWRDRAMAAFDHLDREARTRAWPMAREMHDAISKTEPRGGSTPIPGHSEPCTEIAALRRLAARIVGEATDEGGNRLPYPEPALYGAQAVAMQAAGLLTAEHLRRARSAAYFARKNAYGEDVARRWQADREADHDEAVAGADHDPLIVAARDGLHVADVRRDMVAKRRGDDGKAISREILARISARAPHRQRAPIYRAPARAAQANADRFAADPAVIAVREDITPAEARERIRAAGLTPIGEAQPEAPPEPDEDPDAWRSEQEASA